METDVELIRDEATSDEWLVVHGENNPYRLLMSDS